MSHAHDAYTDNPSEQAAFWRSETLGGLELLRATYFTHQFGRHIHEEYAIGVIEQGAESFFYRGEQFVANAGTIVLVNPGEIHTGHAANHVNGWTYRMLYPSLMLLEPFSTDMLFFPSPVIYDPALAQRLRLLHIRLEKSSPPLEVQTLFYETFSQLVQRYSIFQPKKFPLYRDVIKLAMEYLRAHLVENVSLDDLARVVGLSPFHFLRSFKKEVGLPPHAYQNHLRIQQAKLLLAQHLPLSEIAAQVGFSDQSHFTRRFKEVVGVTPGHYHA
jgi:AraC-like DNA-binding protein